MQHDQKERLLEEAAEKVVQVRETISDEIQKVTGQFERYNRINDPVAQKLTLHFAERLDQLHHMFPSPYFFRCDVTGDDGGGKSLYFGKHQLIEEGVFSWTSPAARLRFAGLGVVEYPLLEGGEWRGKLERKDQFLISGGNIVFMASESEDYSRTLVHQEQLTRRKSGFILPEIVEKMEKAQDDVIRADYRGPFLISGPAGSGKTTLAFHRIAYLLQSPDTSGAFSQEHVIAFVQDEKTRKYFGQLLPELGIHHVVVTTFASWAFERLGLRNTHYIQRANGVDEHLDAYEARKLKALRLSLQAPIYRRGPFHPFDVLRKVYQAHFIDTDCDLLDAQREANEFDRIDLTILLTFEQREHGFIYREEYFEQKKNFEVIRRTREVPLVYNLMVVDEVQNYLPEQIRLLRACVSSETRGMLYVGDLAQQIFLGTMQDWLDAGETLSSDRRVVLEKVYRSTKQILGYIRSVGFDIAVPEELRSGEIVGEMTFADPREEMAFVSQEIEKLPSDIHIGVLSFDEKAISPYREEFAHAQHVHSMTIHQSQGVEFDAVFLIGINRDLFRVSGDDELSGERSRIHRDLVYVALTRAMDKLVVTGKDTLRSIIVDA